MADDYDTGLAGWLCQRTEKTACGADLSAWLACIEP